MTGSASFLGFDILVLAILLFVVTWLSYADEATGVDVFCLR